MRTKYIAVVFSLLFLTAGELVAQEPRTFMVKDPSAIHFELVPTDDRGMDKKDTSNNKPYEVGTRVIVGMDAVNTSQFAVRIVILDQWTQDRPELLRAGDKVSYRKELSKVLEARETEPPRKLPQFIKLEPGERRRIGYVDLLAWFEPLEAGHYQLSIKHRFEAGQDWIESAAIIFDVIPKKRDTRP